MSETEKAQMAEIRAARGRVKASLTRLENTFDEINTRNEISIRLSRLDDLFKEFERLDSNNLSLEESELQEFEERYFYLNAKFNDKLDELNVQNQGRTQNSVASSITSNSNVSNFRLPKLSIPQFNGHFKDWINFKDLFVSTVHSQVSISNVEKFQYLKGLLTNEPASLIKHMPLPNDSYEEAWQKLLDRALLDSGSECCFISERVVNILGLKRKSSKISLRGIAGVTAGQTKGCVDLVIGSQSSNERLEMNAFILNKVTSQIPSEFLDVKDLDYLKSIPLSDEEFMSPKECDIILGSDCFFDILRSGKIVGSKNEPIAQRTMFGWVVAGKLNVKNKEPHELYSHFLSTENELNTDSLLQRFWETEELSVKKQFLSDEEQFCENHFKSNFKYNDEGRFVVKLPIYRDTSRLGNTKGIAISRLLAMERRFQVDKD
ncbi:DUF1758 domain-containing protein [Trichonephila clavipes]|nr:DUF1758 domain-containing protein [Trichonephila clavipes]